MSPPTSAVADDLVRTLRSAGCVFAEDEADLLLAAAHGPAELSELTGRRVAGEPLEQVLGWAEFCGLRIAVAPGVFVPRRRTAFLVECAVDLIRPRLTATSRTVVAVDLCCGTGAIGIALVAAAGRVELHAADVDPAAVDCARQNIGSAGTVYLGDLFEPLPAALQGRVEILTANVPYVPTDAIALMPPEARLYENVAALDGGFDGLSVLRRVSAAAAEWLAPGGHLLVETSEQQAPSAVEIFARNGLTSDTVVSDEYGATVVIGTRPLEGRRAE